MTHRASIVVALTAWLAAAACAEADLSGDEPIDVPGRSDGGDAIDGSDAGATPKPDAGGTSEGGLVVVDGGDGGLLRCDVKDGLDVYCLAPGQSFTTKGTITYGPGFPSGLPAMGLGKPGVGYLPADYPMTCTASPGARGLAPPNNSGGGKICEVRFDNTNTATATGTASYVVSIPPSAPLADYAFGLVATNGTTVTEPAFYLRVAP
ncbi:MAG: hypothetical protein JST00_45640 [Deltaproteobacteria bacterium]|nr:hypothetical protein [Deltaproteobacteria bacterium]